MDKNIKVSICIPTYEMKGLGSAFLNHNLSVIFQQTHKNIEVVISDHSTTDEILNVVNGWKPRLEIIYDRFNDKRGNSSANLNNALKQANGDLIKIIFQDDFLFDNQAIETTVKHFNPTTMWAVSESEHTYDGINFYHHFKPNYHDKIHLGANTISSPSVLTIKNENIELFDENLIWLMDVEYYKRLYDRFGLPTIIPKITVVNRTWNGQVSSYVSQEIKNSELQYVKRKYNE